VGFVYVVPERAAAGEGGFDVAGVEVSAVRREVSEVDTRSEEGRLGKPKWLKEPGVGPMDA
jgi:hypothetical protein